MKKNKASNIFKAIILALSIGSVATFSFAFAEAISPKTEAVSITEYTFCYVIGTEVHEAKSSGTIDMTAPTLPGYSFIGWRLDKNSDKTVYIIGTKFSDINLTGLSENVNLYATYTSTLNLDQRGGNNGNASITCTKDLLVKDIVIPKREGYTFAGYYTQMDGQGTQYYDTNGKGLHIDDIPNGTSLYAHWIENNN